MSVSEWMKEEDMVYLYNRMLSSPENRNLAIMTAWMKLEGIMLSEKESEKDKYYIHI